MRPVTGRKTTSFRVSPDEEELLDAWAAYLAHQLGVPSSHSSVIRYMMRRAKPPQDLGETQARVRSAYSTIFGAQP